MGGAPPQCGVSRKRRTTMGVKFLTPSTEAQGKIDAYLARVGGTD